MASIQGIYVALFGRPADPAGLAYFNEATNNGANLDAIGDLAKTDEYQSRFANMTNEEIVNSIYKSLFERDGEKAGIDFYVGELAAGRLNINNIAIAILDGAKNDDLTTVNAKIAAADIFTSHLDLNAEIEAYRGTFAAQVGREFLDTITKDHLGTPGEADTAILRLFPDQGQQPGTGGGSPGGSSATFVIHHEGSSITKFDGSATGDITLGQKSDGSTPVSMAIASESKSYGTILTGERGNLHIKATFDPSGTTVDATHGVHIESLNSLKPTDSLKLTDDLHVSLSAATADGHAISGAGSVWVSGSEEDQTMITVSATGGNHIEGGLGADTINITGATGSDTIEVRGTDSESIDAVHEAEDTFHQHEAEHQALLDQQQAANDALSEARDVEGASDDDVFGAQHTAQADFEAFGGEQHVEELDQAADDAGALVTERATLQENADNSLATLKLDDQAVVNAGITYGAALLHNTAVSLYSPAALTTVITVGFFPVADNAPWPFNSKTVSNDNIDKATAAIKSMPIDQALKDQLIAALPAKNQTPPLFNDAAEKAAYTAKATQIITDYKASVAQDTADKLDALNHAKEDAAAAHDHYDQDKGLLTQHIKDHPDDLTAAWEQAKENAQHGHDLQQALEDADAAAATRQGLIDTANGFIDPVRESAEHGTELQTTFVTLKNGLGENDSMVGHEDHVIGFQKNIDTLLLPTKPLIVDIDHELTAHYGGSTYHIDITNGIATITAGDDLAPIKLSGDVLQATLEFLSDDNNVHQGETVAFAYQDETGSGLYVFQGGDYGTDTGVKLVGLSVGGETGVTSLNQILQHPV